MRALITGITGQAGSYLAELLLEKGYEVYGLVRRSSVVKYDRIQPFLERVTLLEGDLTDQSSLDSALRETQPDEVYNFAAQSFVPVSWNQPVLTADVTGLGVVRILESIRKYQPKVRFLQASSSEMFGKVVESPQNEATMFHPRSPYGVAKVFAHNTTVNYRESYGLFACACICFNYESPRRGVEFVTRKITKHVARIACGFETKLRMGNLDAQRDWGFAGDYVKAMWRVLQQDEPDDYVIATGVTHSVRELLETAFSCANLDWREYVEVDPKLFRPAEVEHLRGNAAKAEGRLGWRPEVNFKELIEMMVEADIDLVRRAESMKMAAALK